MSDYFERVERRIADRVQTGVPRPSRLSVALGHLGLVAAVLVVIVVAGVFLLAGGGGASRPSPVGQPGATLSFGVAPGDGHAPGPQAIARTLQIMRARLGAAVPAARVASVAGRIVVRVPNPTPAVRAEILALSAPGRLGFYDWEADAITPSGQTVASRLPGQDPAAVEISQGTAGTAPGQLGAGSLPVRQALALTAKLSPAAPRRTEYPGGRQLRVPAGFVLLEAKGSGAADPGVYVLRDRPVMSNGAIGNPQAGRALGTGAPNLQVSFTTAGRSAFQALTATLSRRGARVSGLGETLNQHFAVALDNKLIDVPYIDFKQYPDGITGDNGADLSTGLTTRSARNLAILLRYGPLPVSLTAAG